MNPEKVRILIVGGAIALILISVIITVIVTLVRRKRKMEESSAGKNTLAKGASGENTYEGVSYSYKHFSGTDKAPPYFKITIPCSTKGNFKIKKETKFDRFFKKLGVCIEIETHDPSFDDAFYITTDTILFTTRYLEKSEKRRSIEALFNLGFNELKHDGNVIIVTWTNFPRGKLMEKELMEQAVTQLAVLGRSLPDIPSFEEPGSSSWKYKRILAFVLPGLLLLTGLTALILGAIYYKPLDKAPIFLDSLKYSLPLFILFTWFSLYLLKGRSSSHRELIAVFFISLFAFPLGGVGYEVYLNGALDKNPPAVHKTILLNKYFSKNKNSYTYYAVVKSWRHEDVERLMVSKRFYDYMEPGRSRVTVTTKPGKFGFEWLVSTR
ncbi:MAG: hypothetical protein GY757_20560 [bacterium]|nr:hypothetical protein [bacterium]